MKKITRILLALSAFFLTACGVTREVPYDFPFSYHYVNPHQGKGAVKYGIEPLENRDALTRKVKRHLTHIEEGKYYTVDRLTHSVPYLTPDAADLLKDIGKDFQKSLRKHKKGNYKIIVTSALRTKEDVRKLMKVNSNAVSNSAHCRATTFDITYSRFKYVDGKKVDTRQLKYLLGEVLDKLAKKGRCYVLYETKQTCFHITVSP